MADVFQSPYLPQAAKAPEIAPTFKQILSSSFNMENDLVNWYDYITTPTFAPDTNFDFMSTFKASKLPDNFGSYLAPANSQQEYDMLLAKTQKEFKDQAVLAAGGWTSTLTQLAAGALSPTIFMPFAGQARGGMAFAQVLGLAAVGSAGQNSAMYFNQTTRTEAELYSGIAMDTLLGGFLGGAWLGLSKEGRARLITDMKANEGKVTLPGGTSDLPNFDGERIRTEQPTTAEIKADIRQMGIRDPVEIRDMLDDAVDVGEAIPLRNLPLVPGAIKAKTIDLPAGATKVLETDIADGVTARFVRKVDDAGIEGPYTIKLLDKSGNEIVMPIKGNEPSLLGDTAFVKPDDIRKAYEAGDLDEQLYKMMESVDQPGMGVTERSATIPDTGISVRDAEGVGAQATRARNTGGTMRAPSRARQAAMNKLGKFNPVYRLANQPFFASARDGIMKLDMAGLRQADLATREASPDGGEVVQRIRGYDYYTFAFTKALDNAWLTYHLGGAPAKFFDTAMITQTKSVYGKQVPGKLNWPQFKEAVFDGLNTGKVDPEFKSAVDAFSLFFRNYNERHKQYLAEFATKGMDVKPLYKELLDGEFGEGIVNYAHHIFDQDKIMDNIPEFLKDFGGYNERSLTDSFDNGFKNYAKKKGNMELEQSYNNLTTEQLSGRLDEIEGDLEFLEEIPEWSKFRQDRLDLNKQAKDEGWSAEQLKAERKTMQDDASDSLKDLQAERAELMKRAKTVRNLGGDSNRVMEKLKGDLGKADELISGMLRQTLPQLQKADLSVAKLQKDGDKVMKKAASDVRKVVDAMAKRQAQMSKLLRSTRGNSTSRAKVMEHLDALGVKHKDMLDRLSVAEGVGTTIDVRLSELNLLREDAVREATSLVRGRAAKANDLEDKLDAAAAKIVTPEDKQRIGDQIGEELLDLERSFESKWRDRGNQSEDILSGKSDFKDRSVEIATLLQQRLTHSEIELSPAWLSLRKDARGAALLRVMKIPYELKSKWLVKDVELIARSFDRSMAPDLELWRSFDGSPSGKSLEGQMQAELTEHLTRVNTAKFVKLPKGWVDKSATFVEKVKQTLSIPGLADELFIGPKNFSDTPQEGFVELGEELRTQIAKTFIAAGKEYTTDIQIAIQRLRGLRGRPLDSANKWWRTGKTIKELNSATMMGGTVLSSLSDISRPLSKYSLQRVFQTSWAPFVTSLIGQQGKAYRVMSKDINAKLALNIEPLLQGRAQAIFDTTDETVGRTMLERGVTLASQKLGLVSMITQWTALMKTLSGNVTHATMAEYIPHVAKNWQSAAAESGDLLEMRTYLRNLGLTDMDIFRIGQEMAKPEGVTRFSNGGVLPNLDAWESPAALQAYQAAVSSDVSNMIVTPGLEKPNIVDQNMMASLLFQFKGFTFASNSRVTMSGLQGNDPYLMQGVAFSLAFGALSYYTYALSAGGKTWEKAMEGDPEHWMWQSFQRSGIMGALSLFSDVAQRVPAVNRDDTNEAFLKSSGVLGSLLGPTYTQVDKLGELVMKMDTDNPKQQERNMRTLRQVFVPYQNHFIFRQFLDRAAEAMFGSSK